MNDKKRRNLFLLLGFMRRMKEDHIGAYATQAAYFLIMSFIPFVLFLTALVRYTPLTYRVVRDAIVSVVPVNLQGAVLGIVAEIYSRNSTVMPLAVLTTLWSAGKGFQAMTNGFNVIYHVKETRNWLINRIYSVIWIVLFVVALIGCLIILVLGDYIYEMLLVYVPFIGRMVSRFMSEKGLFVFLVLFIFFDVMYKVLPNRKASFRSQIPGALFTTVAWSVFSYIFSFYFLIFPNFSNIYGSFAALILVMIWLYECMIFMLCGAEINAYFEKEFRKARASLKGFIAQEKENAGIELQKRIKRKDREEES